MIKPTMNNSPDNRNKPMIIIEEIEFSVILDKPPCPSRSPELMKLVVIRSLNTVIIIARIMRTKTNIVLCSNRSKKAFLPKCCSWSSGTMCKL